MFPVARRRRRRRRKKVASARVRVCVFACVKLTQHKTEKIANIYRDTPDKEEDLARLQTEKEKKNKK